MPYNTNMLSLLFSNPLAFAILAVILTIAITIHEFAHAWTADHLGDPTPRLQDRVTLNPLAHLDPLGTFMLVVTGFGWGKPVQFDPYNLQDVRRDTLLVALAGPASNIIMALILALLTPILPWSSLITNYAIHINLILATFNLLPIHPLDGGKILAGLLPTETAQDFDDIMNRYGLFILLALIFFPVNGGAPVDYLIVPVVNFLQSGVYLVANLITGLIASLMSGLIAR